MTGDVGGRRRGSGSGALGDLSGVVISLVVAAALIGGMAYLLRVLANIPPTLRATPVVSSASAKTVTLSLASYPNSLAGEHGKGGGAHPDWVSYGPTTSLHVPAHALVKMTILNYDSSTPLNSPFFSTVQGTVGGVADYNGRPLRRINPAHVAHTFTIHMFPTAGQPNLDVSVPLLGVARNAKDKPGRPYPAPQVITFEFHTGASGRYVWQCFDPCGGPQYYAGFGGPMSTLGYMAGTITVGHANA